MLRFILAVVIGYAAMAILVMAGFSIAFVEPDLAFTPRTLTVTMGWIAYTLVLSFVAALLGGRVCRRIARSGKPVAALAILAFAFGLGSAVMNLSRPEPAFTAEELAAMSKMERLNHTRQPDWYAFTIPLVAPLGILIGGRKGR